MLCDVAAPASCGVLRGWSCAADGPEDLPDAERSLVLLAAAQGHFWPVRVEVLEHSSSDSKQTVKVSAH